MRACIRGAAALLAGVMTIGIASVSAQSPAPNPTPAFMRVLAPPTPAEAIEAPLSARLADKLGQAWFDSADPACRAGKSLDLAAYRKLARAMIVAVGDNMRQFSASVQDAPKAEKQFAAQAGRGAAEELQRLANDSVVKEFLNHNRKRAAVELTQTYLENIERALLLRRVQARQASPLVTGDDILLDIEKVSNAPVDYADTNKKRAMNRFLELMTIAERAVSETSNQAELLKWGPVRLMGVLEGPLKEHCVMKG
jgi:hypothetical protein